MRLRVGDTIHGFAGGAFGRDSYSCRVVEAVGSDWVVTRNTSGQVEFALYEYLKFVEFDDTSYCHTDCGATR